MFNISAEEASIAYLPSKFASIRIVNCEIYNHFIVTGGLVKLQLGKFSIENSNVNSLWGYNNLLFDIYDSAHLNLISNSTFTNINQMTS